MLLNVEKLSKRFGGIWALHDIDLKVNAGEILGILGHGASGKTTLLKVIKGTEKPSVGRIVFADGKAKTELLDGTIPSGPFRILNRGRHDRDTYPHLREVIMSTKADVLLLDDALIRFDLGERTAVYELLQEYVSKGERAVIAASSSFEQLAPVCDRIAVMVAGEIAQAGPVKDVYEEPSTAAVAEATGAMNLFSARRLTSTNAGLPEFYTIDGGHRLFARETEKSALGAINQTIRLGIRPEHISISTDASFPEDNLLKAVVTGIRFLGPLTAVDLEAEGLKLTATVPRVVGLHPDEQCMIAMPPHRIHVFKS